MDISTTPVTPMIKSDPLNFFCIIEPAIKQVYLKFQAKCVPDRSFKAPDSQSTPKLTLPLTLSKRQRINEVMILII